MTPSKRIKLISDIADKFAAEEWSIIDLTLRQFKLPWTDQWNGSDKHDYIVSMTEEADIETLIRLADHLKVNLVEVANWGFTNTTQIKDTIEKIERQKELMISVATDGLRIQEVNNEYKERRLQILSLLQKISVKDPNPFDDLWKWYGKWRDGSLTTYNSRRIFISDLFQPLLDNLYLLSQQESTALTEPTGWLRVDRNIEKVTILLKNSVNEEDFQAVGLLCRESIISLSQAVYNPKIHNSLDGVKPSETDAKRMLENYIASELLGGKNEELRRYAKNAYQLSVTLQHRRSANFRQAALCVEATCSIIKIIAIISGRRDYNNCKQ